MRFRRFSASRDGVPTSCSQVISNNVLEPKGEASDLKHCCEWFPRLDASALQVVTVSDLWIKNMVLAEGSRISERVSVFFKSLQKWKCVPRTSYLLTGCLGSLNADRSWKPGIVDSSEQQEEN